MNKINSFGNSHWRNVDALPQKVQTRGLSESFLNDLASEEGILNPILKYVQSDFTLCLNIREDYINIYYRGGNLLKISKVIDLKGVYYSFYFDQNYITKDSIFREKYYISDTTLSEIREPSDLKKWILIIPFLKQEMDFFFIKKQTVERELQQAIVQENNRSRISASTDYFISDIEYAKKTVGRFDLVAVKWPSDSTSRKNPKCGIAFIELKYGDHSLNGKSGLISHLNGINTFISKAENIRHIKEEMMLVFNQLHKLNLINNKHKIEVFNDKIEVIIILANHDPASTILLDQISKMDSRNYNFEVKFATSNFMGFGLYSECIYGLEEFLEKFQKQITQ